MNGSITTAREGKLGTWEIITYRNFAMKNEIIIDSGYSGTARSSWSRPWEGRFITFNVIFSSESGIISLKYGIEEFLCRVIYRKVLDNSIGCMISGVNQAIHVDVFA